VIPDDWTVTTIGELFSFEGGSQPSRDNFIFQEREGYVRLIQIRDYKTDKYASFVPTNLARRFCSKDDIMIGRYGPPIFQILSGLEGAYNVALIKAVPKKCINKKYGLWLLKQKKLFDFVEKLSQRSSGQTGVDLGELKKYLLSIPTNPAEQELIVSALYDMDDLISNLERQIVKKKMIKHGAMQELLSPKEGWIEYRFEDLGLIDPENLSSDTNPDYQFIYISLEDVDHGFLRNSTELTFSIAPSRARRKVKRGDILISTVRPNLQSHLLVKDDVKDWICSTGFSVLRCNQIEFDSRLIYYHLFGGEISKQIENLISGSNYPSINSKDVKALKIALPNNLPQQKSIADILVDIDVELDFLIQKLQKYKQLKLGMMQNLLTGKIRLI
jgi:type I restriction enzyme S subunit